MESFGRYLAQQRELRGLAASDVARETRLSPAAIEALEGDRFDELPARVFVLGYLRAYARSVGLGPDELVARYDEWRARMGLDQAGEEARAETSLAAAGRGTPSPVPWLAGAALLFVAVLLFWLLG